MDKSIPWWLGYIVFPVLITYGPRYLNKLFRYLFSNYRKWQLRKNYRRARRIIEETNHLINNKWFVSFYKNMVEDNNYLGIIYIVIIYLLQFLTFLVFDLNDLEISNDHSFLLGKEPFITIFMGAVYIMAGIMIIIGFNRSLNRAQYGSATLLRYKKKISGI